MQLNIQCPLLQVFLYSRQSWGLRIVVHGNVHTRTLLRDLLNRIKKTVKWKRDNFHGQSVLKEKKRSIYEKQRKISNNHRLEFYSHLLKMLRTPSSCAAFGKETIVVLAHLLLRTNYTYVYMYQLKKVKEITRSECSYWLLAISSHPLLNHEHRPCAPFSYETQATEEPPNLSAPPLTPV